VTDTEGKFCTSCYTGVYPTDLVQLEVREGGANGKFGEGRNAKSVDAVASQRPVAVEHES
jgi:hypothetical protein